MVCGWLGFARSESAVASAPGRVGYLSFAVLLPRLELLAARLLLLVLLGLFSGLEFVGRLSGGVGVEREKVTFLEGFPIGTANPSTRFRIGSGNGELAGEVLLLAPAELANGSLIVAGIAIGEFVLGLAVGDCGIGAVGMMGGAWLTIEAGLVAAEAARTSCVAAVVD